VAAFFPGGSHSVLSSQVAITIPHYYALCSARCILRCFLIYNGLRIKPVSFRGEAAASSQLELPAMHGTCEHAIFYMGEARQVGLQVGTAALDAVAMAFP